MLCQTMTMKRITELKSDCQRENASFSFWCRVKESVVGPWNCHVWYAGFLTVNACSCCLLLSVIWHGFSRLCVSSILAALFEGQWSALPTSAHSREDGSLTVKDRTLCAESREQVLLVVRVRTLHLAQL